MLAFSMPEFSSHQFFYVMSTIGIGLMVYLMPILKALAKTARANADNAALDLRTRLIAAVEAFVLDSLTKIWEVRFPALNTALQGPSAATVVNKASVITEIRSWFPIVKEEAISHFRIHDVDLVKKLGDEAIDKAIRNAVVRVPALASPAMAEEVSQQVKDVVDSLIAKAVTPSPAA